MKITAYKERKETLGNVYLTNLMKKELNQRVWLEGPTHGTWEGKACGLSSCG